MKKNLYEAAMIVSKYFFIGFLVQFVAFSTLFGEPVEAQLNNPVRANLHEISVGRVFTILKKSSNLTFVYDTRAINNDQSVTIPGKNLNVADVLNKLSARLHLTYKKIGNTVTVKKRRTDHVPYDLPVLKTSLALPAAAGKIAPMPFYMKEHTVSGTVMDSLGNPLIGVSVQVKGTSQGTVTDANGHFTIEASENATLIFSYVGYQNKEVAVNGKSTLDVVLSSSATGLNEVVVVGYGTQKKVDLTGAVATVDGENLEKRTVAKTSLALVGQLSGISVRQGSGNPVNDGGSLLIRGEGTFSSAGNAPLVLVDGIQSTLDNVDPNDIASISVLKDAASASIYGSRAANGVILITTRKGIVGKPIISYSSYVGKQVPTFLPKMINSWQYAKVINSINPGTYTDAEIQKFKSGVDPIKYPNFDHINYLFKSGKGVVTKQNISARGGNELTKYSFSFGYYDNQSIIEKNNARRYNFRLNLNTRLNDKLKLNIETAGSKNNSKEPSAGASEGLADIILGAMRNANTIPGPTGDGYYGRNEIYHPEADLNSKSFVKYSNYRFYGNAKVVWDIIKGLKITGQGGYTQNKNRSLYFRAEYPVTPTYSIKPNSLNDSWSKNNNLILRAFLNYDKKVKDNNFHFLGGIERVSASSKNISAYRDNFPNNDIYVISAGSPTNGKESGSASKHTLASYFGRINYNFKEKYLVEANIRVDGSSRFPASDRWGTFPSFSAGWVISKENFFHDVLPWINNLKFRASWGKLGNQSIGNYPYQNLLSVGINYPYGGVLYPGVAVSRIPNKNITWETTTMSDVGLDLALLSEKLKVSIDYYNKVTSNILYQISVSSLLGASPSPSNAGKVGNKGWDFQTSYQNSIGEFTFGASAILSIVHNKVLSLANVTKDIAKGLFVGYPIGSSYGYVSDGLFANKQEVAKYASQPFSLISTAGGIKLVDLSGPDGRPDGKVGPTYDRKIIGNPLPITTYSLTLNAGFKNFDLYVLMQGEGGRKAPVSLSQFFYPLENNGNIQRIFYEHSWNAENPNPHAEFPKIVPIPVGFYNQNPISFWYRNATFLRIKSVQLGYSLPKHILNNSFLNKVRIYVSGKNIATFTNYYKDWDPEMNTSGSFYPLLKTFSVGIDVKF